MKELTIELDEARASHELSLQEARLENLEARKQLRRLQGQGSYAEVFELYESKLASIQAELGRSRASLCEVEGTCRDLVLQRGGGGEGGAADGRLAKVRSWRRALASTEKENGTLRTEVAALEKRQRQGEVHRKAAEDATRKLHRLAREHEQQLRELRDARLSLSEATAQRRAGKDEQGGLQARLRLSEARVAELSEALVQSHQAQSAMQLARRKEGLLLRVPRGGADATRRIKYASGRASELLRSLEAEMSAAGVRGARVNTLFGKATREVDALEAAQAQASARETELLSALTEDDVFQSQASLHTSRASSAAR